MACSETDLVELARTDLEAFGELVTRYRGCIIRQCRSRVSDAHIAEDLAQETFIRAYLKLDQLREPSFFAGWLRKIASNVCNEYVRGPARLECVWDAPPEQQSTDAVDRLDSDARLDVLPRAMRECVELYYGGQLSYAEIADVLGVSQATVRNRLHRAKAMLRKGMPELEKRTFTDRVMDRLRALESGDAVERARAASDLRGSLDKDDRYQFILDILRGVGEPWMWDLHGAIRGSKKHRSAEMRDALLAIVLGSDEEGARIMAAGALVAQKDPTVIGHLKRVLENPREDRDVIAGVKSTIAQLAKMELPPPPNFESFRLRRDVEDAAKDKSARLELMKKLIAALDDDSATVRNEAVKALGKLGDRRAAPALAKRFKDPVFGIREAAVIALGELGGKTAGQALARVLDDDPSLWRAASSAISTGRPPGVVPAVLRAIARWDTSGVHYTVVHFLLLCLRGIATADDLDAIREAMLGLMRDRPFLSSIWAEILAHAADGRHLAELEEALRVLGERRSPEADQVVEALWRIGGQEAIDVLKKHFLTYGNHKAGGYLVSLGKPGLETLKEALRSDNQAARVGVYWTIRIEGGAELIRESGDQEAADLLRAAAEAETTYAKMHAKAAVYRLDKPRMWDKVAEARRAQRKQ